MKQKLIVLRDRSVSSDSCTSRDKLCAWRVRSPTYVDCSSRSGPPVYLHRSGHTHFGSEPGDDLAHAHRYFPEHRYPGDRGCLAVHRHELRGIGKPAHEPV